MNNRLRNRLKFVFSLIIVLIFSAVTFANRHTDNTNEADSGAQPSAKGSRVTASITASRTACTSPCTIVFSAQDTTDTAAANAHDVFKNLGFHFVFDDPMSGKHSVTGLPQNSQIGGPIATHTFICKSGQCTFNVGVRAQNTSGKYDDNFVKVTVDSADFHYSGANTICVSTSNNWAGDKPCPRGATRQKKIPKLGHYSGKRIMLRRGETFKGKVCIGYDESNVLIESFGNAADKKPELIKSANIGVLGGCNKVTLSTKSAKALPARWAENITLSDIRVVGVSMGMSYHHVGLHDLDLDYRNSPLGGFIELSRSGKFCAKKPRLDCSVVPYPNGLYISSTTAVGSTSAGKKGKNGGAGVLFGGYNCPMINWLGIINTTFWNSNQHQLRLEGGQRISLSHNNARGHTLGTPPKHVITIRSCGPADVDIQKSILAGTGRINALQGQKDAPQTKWIVIADNFIGSKDAVNPTFKLQIAPSNGRANESLSDAVVERNTFLHNSADASIDLAFNGSNMTARTNNTYTPDTQRCKDTGAKSANPNWVLADCAGEIPPIPAAPGS